MSPPLSHWGWIPGEISFYRAQRGKSAPETCAGCPKQRYATGEPGREPGTGPCGDGRRVLWACGHRPRVVCSSDPRVAYPDVKVQVWDLVRVVGIVAPFCPTRGGYPGKFVLSSPGGGLGPGDVCRVHPEAVRHGRASQSSGTVMCGDCRRVLWVPRSRGNFVLSSPGGGGNGPRRLVPGAPSNVQGPHRVWIVEGSCGYRTRGVSIRENFVLSSNLGYKTRGVAK